MNAKHLFLTLTMLLASFTFALADTVKKDIISFSNLNASYRAAIDAAGVSDGEEEFEFVDCAFTSNARYTGYLYFYSSISALNAYSSSTGVYSTTESGGTLKSIKVYWHGSTTDEDGIRLYLNHSPYAGSDAMPSSAATHDVIYDGTNPFTYYEFVGEYEYIAIGGLDDPYFTSIEIEWIEKDVTTYTITKGAITGGAWETNMTVSKTTAEADEEITLHFTPTKAKNSLKSFTVDDMTFDLSCIGYVDKDETYTFKFLMPAKDITITAVFGANGRKPQTITIKEDDAVVTETTILSGVNKTFTFERVAGGDPVVGGKLTCVIDNPSLAAATIIDNGDGTGTCTLTGLADGTTRFYISATKSAIANAANSSYVNFTVNPRPVAIVAEYDGSYYAMVNSIDGVRRAASTEIYKADDKYYYSSDVALTDITWSAVTTNAGLSQFTLRNSSGSYLKINDNELSLTPSSYTWYKDAGVFYNGGSWGLMYQNSSSTFVGNMSYASAGAKEVSLGANFLPLNYSTASSSAGVYDTRTLGEGDWGTICVPFDVTDVSESGADFFTLTGKHVEAEELVGFYLSNSPVSSLTAGRSYIYHVQAGKSAISLNGASAILTEADNSVLTDGFVGILPGDCDGTGKVRVENESKDKVNGNFVMSGGKFRYISAGGASNVKAYRAYIDAGELDASSGTPAPGRRILYIKDMQDVATDIEDLTVGQLIDWSKPVYNIMGMQVGKGATGVLIQDGQKFIVQ